MTTRRRFLTILASATALPARAIPASAATRQWKGIALGANARIILDHPRADALLTEAVTEIGRLESLFSLYRDSQLTRLNRDGVLPGPAPEMLEILSICSAINARTNGAFDPTIQPFWALYAESYAAGTKPTAAQIAAVSTGWKHLRFSPAEVAFTRPGMALTLNGIAQGYIADRVGALLRADGVRDVLVNTGEILASGTAPDGKAWPVRLGHDGTRTVALSNVAVATSAPLGTTFDQQGRVGHIIDPRTGQPGGLQKQISVISTSAAMADGLSTAFCLMTEDEIDAAKGDAEVL